MHEQGLAPFSFYPFLFHYRFLKKLTNMGRKVFKSGVRICISMSPQAKKCIFFLKSPSGVFMDDCYHETRHRDVPFAENRNYEMVLCQRKTDKNCLWFERRHF